MKKLLELIKKIANFQTRKCNSQTSNSLGRDPSAIFPDFHWDGYSWKTYVEFKNWSSKPVCIVFAPEGRGEEPLVEQEKELVRWVVENQEKIYTKLMAYFLTIYPTIEEEYEDAWSSAEEAKGFFPQVTKLDEIGKVLSIPTIYVHQLEKNDQPFFGVTFESKWDVEHGLGFLLHGDKVLERGLSDTAILLWRAKKYL